MAENNKDNSDEDLSNFHDYLTEFNDLVIFDAEVCPTCGVDLSDSLNIINSPYIKVLSSKENVHLLQTASQLEQENITTKIEAKLDTSVIEKISYIYELLIPIKDCEKFHKLIEEKKIKLNN